jgi:hypothetical protein
MSHSMPAAYKQECTSAALSMCTQAEVKVSTCLHRSRSLPAARMNVTIDRVCHTCLSHTTPIALPIHPTCECRLYAGVSLHSKADKLMLKLRVRAIVHGACSTSQQKARQLPQLPWHMHMPTILGVHLAQRAQLPHRLGLLLQVAAVVHVQHLQCSELLFIEEHS